MTEVPRIIDQLKRAFTGPAWHGPSVMEVLQDVSAEQAARKPLSGAHNIWEITAHIAAWEGAVLSGLRGGSTNLTDEEDWPDIQDTSEFAGGLPGAVEKGFPRNYWLQSYWGVLPYINEHLPENAMLAAEEDNVLVAYQQFGMLREDIIPCRGTNAASLNKCEYFLKREPLNDTVKSTTDVLFTFSLEGVPLASVFTITPALIEEKKRKEKEERIKKNRLKRKAT